MSIHIIGDSHVSSFSGRNIIVPEYPPNLYMNGSLKIRRIGAPLAYSLGRYDSYYKAREKLEHILKHEIQKNDSVILSFGEIDCRYHILKQAKTNNKDMSVVVIECVKRYIESIYEIFKNYYHLIDKVGVWGPIASTWLGNECSNRDCPITDRMPLRNVVTDKFNSELKVQIHDLNMKYHKTKIFYLSIFEHLIDDKFFTKREFYMDNIHLSEKAFPLIINELSNKGFLI